MPRFPNRMEDSDRATTLHELNQLSPEELARAKPPSEEARKKLLEELGIKTGSPSSQPAQRDEEDDLEAVKAGERLRRARLRQRSEAGRLSSSCKPQMSS